MPKLKKKRNVYHIGVTWIRIDDEHEAYAAFPIIDDSELPMMRKDGLEAFLVDCGDDCLRIMHNAPVVDHTLVSHAFLAIDMFARQGLEPYRTSERI